MGEKNQGSWVGERPGSGADAWRTMGLSFEGDAGGSVARALYRLLRIAGWNRAAKFNEVHSKVCSSASALREGARLEWNRRWEGEGGAEMSS